MKEAAWRKNAEPYYPGEELDASLALQEHRGDTVLENAMLEGFDVPLLSKLTVLEGSPEPLADENRRAIALEIPDDDGSFVFDAEDYPAIGETVTVVYVDEYGFRDTRTGTEADENTPPEYIEWYVKDRHEADYTVCAYVGVPYAMGHRYSQPGYSGVLNADVLRRDSGQNVVPLFYLFDTPDEAAEQEAEAYLAQLTAGETNPLMYESKETARAEFENFQKMFLLMGGVLCAIIGLVGTLNFLNTMVTAILARKKEFAVLQAVGMTGNQLKSMLVYEGLLYSVGSAAIALLLAVILNPLTASLLENMFWFYTARFTLIPVLAALPVFALLGWLIPAVLYRQTAGQSVVERLREGNE